MLYTGKRIIRADYKINRIAINYTAALLLAVYIFTIGCYFAEGHFFSRFHETENNRLKNIARIQVLSFFLLEG